MHRVVVRDWILIFCQIILYSNDSQLVLRLDIKHASKFPFQTIDVSVVNYPSRSSNYENRLS